MTGEKTASNHPYDLPEVISRVQDKFRDILPSTREASFLTHDLNLEFEEFLGKPIEVDCGIKYIVVDGDITGIEMANGRDLGERPNGGLKDTGLLQRFDVLEYADELITRGTKIYITEPCLVYREIPDRYQAPSSALTEETYIPLVRIGNLSLQES